VIGEPGGGRAGPSTATGALLDRAPGKRTVRHIDRRSAVVGRIFFKQENWRPGSLGLLQQYLPLADSCAAKIPSFDNIIGAGKQCRRHFETERLGGLEINEQLNFCGLLDRQIGRFFAL
jgi:hypothetical protein